MIFFVEKSQISTHYHYDAKDAAREVMKDHKQNIRREHEIN